MMNFSKPLIERFWEDIPLDDSRREAANAICHYFSESDSMDRRRGYYPAVESLLRDQDSERILLYLPFAELTGAPKSFKDAYMNSWYGLLGVYDARENFHKGDTFEVDARPNGEVERVVKCAHLTPWLLQAGFIGYSDLFSILSQYHDDVVLLQSFRDTWKYIHDNNLLSYEELQSLSRITDAVSARTKTEPLYISKKRIEWLNEQTKPLGELLTPNASLEGPFSPNLEMIRGKVIEISKQMQSDDVILIGGSQLKGYGTVDSDLDIWNLNDLKSDPLFYPGSPHGAHIYFNSFWIGRDNVAKIAKDIMGEYIKSANRSMSIERIEADLLLYRLLHKGFSRFTGNSTFQTSNYKEMDGNCPFYDDHYRRVATMLYAKYVTIPDHYSK